MTSIDDLAKEIDDLRQQVTDLTRAAQLGDSSITQAGETIDLAAAVTAAVGTPAALAGLQDVLDANEDALAAAREEVAAAVEAAQEASDAGVAAGALASDAADAALVKAQEALDAAAAAGGGSTYTNRIPTADDPGTSGKAWFVWDSNYHITDYYVYQDDTVKWVKTVLDDGTFGNLSAGHITSGFIDAARIAAASLTAAVLAADTITSREIGADAILARNIKAAEITGDKIAARTIAAGNIVADTITAAEIKAGTITADEIAANSITANEINLDTLNGKTLNGLSINGASLNTTQSGNAGNIKISGSTISVFDSAGNAAGSIFGLTGGTQFLYGASGFTTLTGGNVTSKSTVGTNACQMTLSAGASSNVSLSSYTSVNGTTVRSGRIDIGAQDLTGAASNGAWDLSVVDLLATGIIRARSANDVSLSSTNHAFQIGPDSGANIAMDNNEIQARTGIGSSNSIFINTSGGNVGLGNSASTVTVGGTFVNAKLPSRIAAGTASSSTSVVAGGNTSVTVTFPTGRFASAPVVTASPSNGRFTAVPQSVTATGFTISLTNVTSATGVPGNVTWQAMDAG